MRTPQDIIVRKRARDSWVVSSNFLPSLSTTTLDHPRPSLYRCIAMRKYKTTRSIKHVGITNTRTRVNVHDAQAPRKIYILNRRTRRRRRRKRRRRRRDAHCYKLTVESLESSISSPFTSASSPLNQFLSQVDA